MKNYNGDENHYYLRTLLETRISPGPRQRWQREEVEPLSGANTANLCGIYSINPESDQVDPLESAANSELAGIISQVLSTLTPRQCKVITLRFGLCGGKEHTLEEVSRIFNMTREKIRQIEAKALRKLRHPSRACRLKSFLE